MREQIKAAVNEMKEINDITLKNEIVIFGSTYMKNFPFYELVNKCKLENAIYNRSIEDLTLGEALEILQDTVLDIKPNKIFLCFSENEKDRNSAAIYKEIIYKIRKELPKCQIYVIELPAATNEKLNKQIENICDGKKIISIKFANNNNTKIEKYKEQFKQLTHYFRDKNLSLSEIFAVANL